MVRLEVFVEPENQQPVKAFQFHYGTIGRNIDFLMNHFSFYISIPLWYDWKEVLQPIHPLKPLISIPLWYDWKVRLAFALRLLCVISIPLWYDWKGFRR